MLPELDRHARHRRAAATESDRRPKRIVGAGIPRTGGARQHRAAGTVEAAQQRIHDIDQPVGGGAEWRDGRADLA